MDPRNLVRSKVEIELVAFDMDGVLAHLDRPRRLEILSAFTSKSPDFLQRTIYASDFEPKAEAGWYTPGSEYLAELVRRIDAPLTREQWIAARRDAMTPIAETLAIARDLRDRVAITTLTNNGALLKESIREILPSVAELFGLRFHASYEFGARKPDPRVFTRLAGHFGVAPDRILFVDDALDNVLGAEAAGLRARTFRSALELSEELRALGLA